jgi:putative Mg2+ transporter-C (MgtC) family protein
MLISRRTIDSRIFNILNGTEHIVPIAVSIGAAWLAGSIIGLERSFHGRPAGFRTHALVCLSSAFLMAAMNYQEDWLGPVAAETIRFDPARMAQGIMTGIGFLGAGVIFKEGLTVRGLTTAASIWTTAAIGILFGIGFFIPAVLTTLVTFGTLSVFRVIEDHIPTQFYAHNIIRFLTDKTMPEDALRAFLKERGFVVTSMSYRLEEGGGVFEYRMMLRTLDKDRLRKLACDLREVDGVLEFRIAPGD